jgi:hypothetical protein
VRDKFYEYSHSPSWTVHRKMAMHRPSWSEEERDDKIITYGGSRQNPDYKRNIYGEHGDATNPLFVLARLMACVDQENPAASTTRTSTPRSRSATRSCRVGRRSCCSTAGSERDAQGRLVRAPKGYSAYYAGMDVGATIDPSEILVFGQRAGTQREQLDLLTRIQMQRISLEDQEEIVNEVLRFYGDKMVTFSIDRTGLGFDLYQRLHRSTGSGSRATTSPGSTRSPWRTASWRTRRSSRISSSSATSSSSPPTRSVRSSTGRASCCRSTGSCSPSGRASRT